MGYKISFMFLAAWPSGTYGLPKPATGCPLATGFQWRTGYRFQHTEDGSRRGGSFFLHKLPCRKCNKWSNGIHFPKGFGAKDHMKQHFCMKTGNGGSRNWPRGNYCIFKKGSCPSGKIIKQSI